nr:hypothetical protein [uncultured Hyphomonas sp.]
MTRAMIIPAAFVLLTFMPANAQEMNKDGATVNASKAEVFDEVPADQEGMSVKELNELQYGNLEQDGLEIDELKKDADVDAKATMAAEKPAKTETAEPEEEVFYTEESEEIIGPDEDVTVVEVSGPYVETEAEAAEDGDVDNTPEQ